MKSPINEEKIVTVVEERLNKILKEAENNTTLNKNDREYFEIFLKLQPKFKSIVDMFERWKKLAQHNK